MFTHLEWWVRMALPFLARLTYMCGYYLLLYWLTLPGCGLDKWGNLDMLQVYFTILGMFFHGRGTDARERTETLKAS